MVLLAVLLALPLAGLALLLGYPDLDAEWDHQPSHFWLVLVVAVVSVGLGLATGEAARRRGDARVFLVALAFLVAAGFLGLHALATPGVLLDATNTGFVIATPVGLLLAAGFAAASALDLSPATSAAIMRRQRPAARRRVRGARALGGRLARRRPAARRPLPARSGSTARS